MSAAKKINASRERTKKIEKKINKYREIAQGAYLEGFNEVVRRLSMEGFLDKEKVGHLMGADIKYSWQNSRTRKKLEALKKERLS